MNEQYVKELIRKRANRLLRISFVVMTFLVFGLTYSLLDFDFLTPKTSETNPLAPIDEELDRIENGIHLRTGLKEGDGMFVVIGNCTNCHSAKLLTQNRMTAERWDETIEWMQETQNLWDLGENQEVIVNYLVTNYPPNRPVGRRANLTNIEWYELED